MESIWERDGEDEKKMGAEADGVRVERNASEELAKMASSLMVAAQSPLHEQGGGGEDEEENTGSSAATLKPLVKRARKLLFRRLRVGVEDGRIFVGKFHCLDKQGNIILYDTMEFRQITSPSSSSSHVTTPSGADKSSSSSAASADGAMEQRSLGLVLIPARCRTSCFVECSLQEQFSLLSI